MRCDVVHKRAGSRASAGCAERVSEQARPRRLQVVVLSSLLFLQVTPLDAATLQEAEARQTEAEASQAALLSPTSYLRGTEALQQARARAGGTSRQQSIDAALSAFDAALDTAAIAREVFTEALASRVAANRAEAFRLAATDWARAEKTFNAAVKALERGTLSAAEQRGGDAMELYQAAELSAVKARYLGAARNAILNAEQARAERFAPRSLLRAQELLSRAETALDKDRSMTTDAAALAEDAAYHARLAVYIAGQAQRVRAKEATVEDLILENQAVVGRLAETAGTSDDFSAGYATPEAELRSQLERLPVLESELEQSRRQVAGLEDEIRELDQRLGSASSERRDLMRRVEANARVREQFAVVETLFDPEQAVVLRNGNDLILRMVGLRFPSGSARLDDQARALLNRLENAIDIFPRCQVRVEGHTDSSGRPQLNQTLSQKRAKAVADYLVETTGIQEFRVQAAGYGDSRPVTSNRTREGRAQNRRIDIVIVPRLNEGS